MTKPRVGIIMGSDSDLPVMKAAAEVLEDEFGIPVEVNALSAHRTPKQAIAWAQTAEERGLQVIIAAAGGAAHLAGVCAANTTVPVIGVPVESKSLKGHDSLLSTVQMPPGTPVATVSINGARNAGILAAYIIGVADPAIRDKTKEFKAALEKKVVSRNEKLQKEGYKNYAK